MKIFKRILSILGWTVLGALLVVGIWNTVDKVTGYKCPIFGMRMSVVVSSSMETIYPGRDLPEDTARIKKNEVIVTNSVSNYSDINMYDVLTYYNGKALICHRVVDLYTSDGVNYIVTQGDANNTPDVPIAFSLVNGRVINVLPSGIGNFLLFIQSGYGVMAICFSVAFILLGIFIYNNTGTRKNKGEIDDKDKSKKKKAKTLDNKVSSNGPEKKEVISESDADEVASILLIKIKCIKCGTIFETPQQDIYVCPECGTKMKRKIKSENEEK